MNGQLREPLQQVIGLLVDGKYSEIEALTRGVRLNAQEISSAITEYGRHLVSPPESAFALMNVVEVRNTHPTRWSVVMPLWPREEGRSDLSLEATIIGKKDGFAVELDDIHVL